MKQLPVTTKMVKIKSLLRIKSIRQYEIFIGTVALTKCFLLSHSERWDLSAKILTPQLNVSRNRKKDTLTKPLFHRCSCNQATIFCYDITQSSFFPQYQKLQLLMHHELISGKHFFGYLSHCSLSGLLLKIKVAQKTIIDTHYHASNIKLTRVASSIALCVQAGTPLPRLLFSHITQSEKERATFIKPQFQTQ